MLDAQKSDELTHEQRLAQLDESKVSDTSFIYCLTTPIGRKVYGVLEIEWIGFGEGSFRIPLEVHPNSKDRHKSLRQALSQLNGLSSSQDLNLTNGQRFGTNIDLVDFIGGSSGLGSYLNFMRYRQHVEGDDRWGENLSLERIPESALDCVDYMEKSLGEGWKLEPVAKSSIDF